MFKQTQGFPYLILFSSRTQTAVYYGIVADAQGNAENIDMAKYPASLGVTIELCAGIVDKSIPFNEIAREEVLEECGYDVQLDRIEEVMTYRYDNNCTQIKFTLNNCIIFYSSGVGASGALQKMYYVEVTDADKASCGGGVDDELIDVVEYTIDAARDMVKQGASNPSPPSCLLGVMWFLSNKV